MQFLHEDEEYRNRHRVFRDRTDAGERLARMLEPVYGSGGPGILLAIPMGGVPVAIEIRERLGWPLDLVIVRKIQIPGNTEAGFGAMTQEGDVFLNEPLMARLQLSPRQVQQQTEKVRQELAERNRRLRGNRPFPAMEGKTVILVDDGLASGFTMKASVYMVRKRNAAKTVIAAPTAPLRTVRDLEGAVDEIFCPNIRDTASFAVADAYVDWYDLSEKEVEKRLADLA